MGGDISSFQFYFHYYQFEALWLAEKYSPANQNALKREKIESILQNSLKNSVLVLSFQDNKEKARNW